jgi:uncharacterized Fe-S cluster protein YjdI/CDGSH-type Zn-finger protein
MARRSYRGEQVDVSFDADLCIHATECVRALPVVFDRSRRPWILPDNGSAEEVAAVVRRCPSGALQYRRLDGGADESPSAVVTVTPVENGPLVLRGDLLVRHEDGTRESLPRVALCRCGQSKNKPFCDNSHLTVGFQASGASPMEAVSDGAAG